MDDPNLREYAQRENDYILSLVLRPERAGTHENAEKLAERNVGATERSFGASDPMHAMALNTFAFVLLQSNEKLDVARNSARKALELMGGVAGQDELVLESRCLIALAAARTGAGIAAAIRENLTSSAVPTGDEHGLLATAGRELAALLSGAVYENPVTRVLVILTLRDLAFAILEDPGWAEPDADREALEESLGLYLGAYYGSADAGEPDEADDDADDVGDEDDDETVG